MGVIVMGIVVPITLYFLLPLSSFTQAFAVAAVTFTCWGIADLIARILERPRLKGRSPAQALKEDWERRSKE